MTNKLKTFDDSLMEMLQDDQFALGYITEAINGGDSEVALVAIKDVRRSTKPEQTQEVEEGKAHVMRWVSMKGKWCEPTETWLLHGGSENPFAGSGWDDEFIKHHATFNNNNGEIPTPKGGSDEDVLE